MTKKSALDTWLESDTGKHAKAYLDSATGTNRDYIRNLFLSAFFAGMDHSQSIVREHFKKQGESNG